MTAEQNDPNISLGPSEVRRLAQVEVPDYLGDDELRTAAEAVLLESDEVWAEVRKWADSIVRAAERRRETGR